MTNFSDYLSNLYQWTEVTFVLAIANTLLLTIVVVYTISNSVRHKDAVKTLNINSAYPAEIRKVHRETASPPESAYYPAERNCTCCGHKPCTDSHCL